MLGRVLHDARWLQNPCYLQLNVDSEESFHFKCEVSEHRLSLQLLMLTLDNSINFTAIDFETAHGAYHSICQVGLVRIEQGKVVHTINQLVQPPDNYYHWGNVRVHGITKKHTANAPTFDQIWHLMEPYVANQLVVAHNATFDVTCLKKTLAFYEMPIPPFNHACTYKIFKSNLKALAAQYNIPLNHHDALSDAMACAQLYLIHLETLKSPHLFSGGQV